MAEQSKMVPSGFYQELINLIAGSRKKQFISATIVLIIGFLIQIRKGKSDTESIRVTTGKKKVIHLISREEKETLTPFFGKE